MGKKQVSVITPSFPISQVPQFYIVSVGACVWMGKKQVSVITPSFPISQVPQFYIVSVGGLCMDGEETG